MVWTEAHRRGIALARVAEWMCARPARLAGLADRKGTIARGRDADLCFFDPDVDRRIDGAALHHRHPITPYHGETLRGAVIATYVRGEPVYASGQHVGSARGSLLGVS